MDEDLSRIGSYRSLLFDQLIIKSWWVILFLFLCLFAYDQAMKRRSHEKRRLEEKRLTLLAQKEQTFALQHSLHAEIASFSDPAWLEIILRQELGLVGEGETKIYFN